MMKGALVIILGLCLGSATGQASELTDPVEILEKVDAAAKAVQSVRYKVTFEGTGAAETQAPTMEATVVMSGWFSGTVEMYRCEAKITPPGSTEPYEITAGTDGAEFYLIDHRFRKAYINYDPSVMGLHARLVQALLVPEFVHPTPFSDEIRGTRQELRGSKTIGGEDCYEIGVVYTPGQRTVWHFSKKDFLPRGRHELLTVPPGARGGQQKLLTDLVIDPVLKKGAFKFKLPEGYTRTEDFAP